MQTWVENHRPRRLREVAGNANSIKALRDWAEEWKTGAPKKRAVLLYGPAGVGKTSAAYALARELGYDCIELNASDSRTKGIVDRIVGSAASLGTLNPRHERKVIILDEVDGIHGTADRGGLAALKKWVKETLQPMVLIANDPWSLPREFRELILMLEFRKLDKRTILGVLKEVCSSEDLAADEKALNIIAANANGDLRAAINDLQSLSTGKRRLTLADMNALRMRDSELGIFEILARIFKTDSCDNAIDAVKHSEEEHETIMKWLAENMPNEYRDSGDLARAFNALSRADVFLGRIHRRSDWSLLPYVVDNMSAGVATAKKHRYEGYTRYERPQIFALYAQTKGSREEIERIAGKIASRCHCSRREARLEFLPMLRTILNNDFERGAQIVSELELDEEDVQFLVKEEMLANKILVRAQEITSEHIKRSMHKVKQASLFEFGK